MQSFPRNKPQATQLQKPQSTNPRFQPTALTKCHSTRNQARDLTAAPIHLAEAATENKARGNQNDKISIHHSTSHLPIPRAASRPMAFNQTPQPPNPQRTLNSDHLIPPHHQLLPIQSHQHRIEPTSPQFQPPHIPLLDSFDGSGSDDDDLLTTSPPKRAAIADNAVRQDLAQSHHLSLTDPLDTHSVISSEILDNQLIALEIEAASLLNLNQPRDEQQGSNLDHSSKMSFERHSQLHPNSAGQLSGFPTVRHPDVDTGSDPLGDDDVGLASRTHFPPTISPPQQFQAVKTNQTPLSPQTRHSFDPTATTSRHNPNHHHQSSHNHPMSPNSRHSLNVSIQSPRPVPMPTSTSTQDSTTTQNTQQPSLLLPPPPQTVLKAPRPADTTLAIPQTASKLPTHRTTPHHNNNHNINTLPPQPTTGLRNPSYSQHRAIPPQSSQPIHKPSLFPRTPHIERPRQQTPKPPLPVPSSSIKPRSVHTHATHLAPHHPTIASSQLPTAPNRHILRSLPQPVQPTSSTHTFTSPSVHHATQQSHLATPSHFTTTSHFHSTPLIPTPVIESFSLYDENEPSEFHHRHHQQQQQQQPNRPNDFSFDLFSDDDLELLSNHSHQSQDGNMILGQMDLEHDDIGKEILVGDHQPSSSANQQCMLNLTAFAEDSNPLSEHTNILNNRNEAHASTINVQNTPHQPFNQPLPSHHLPLTTPATLPLPNLINISRQQTMLHQTFPVHVEVHKPTPQPSQVAASLTKRSQLGLPRQNPTTTRINTTKPMRSANLQSPPSILPPSSSLSAIKPPTATKSTQPQPSRAALKPQSQPLSLPRATQIGSTVTLGLHKSTTEQHTSLLRSLLSAEPSQKQPTASHKVISNAKPPPTPPQTANIQSVTQSAVKKHTPSQIDQIDQSADSPLKTKTQDRAHYHTKKQTIARTGASKRSSAKPPTRLSFGSGQQSAIPGVSSQTLATLQEQLTAATFLLQKQCKITQTTDFFHFVISVLNASRLFSVLNALVRGHEVYLSNRAVHKDKQQSGTECDGPPDNPSSPSSYYEKCTLGTLIQLFLPLNSSTDVTSQAQDVQKTFSASQAEQLKYPHLVEYIQHFLTSHPYRCTPQDSRGNEDGAESTSNQSAYSLSFPWYVNDYMTTILAQHSLSSILSQPPASTPTQTSLSTFTQQSQRFHTLHLYPLSQLSTSPPTSPTTMIESIDQLVLHSVFLRQLIRMKMADENDVRTATAGVSMLFVLIQTVQQAFEEHIAEISRESSDYHTPTFQTFHDFVHAYILPLFLE